MVFLLSSKVEEEFPSIKARPTEIPATLVTILGEKPPLNLKKIKLPKKYFECEQVVLILIDNWGLFECTYFGGLGAGKQLIKLLDVFVLFETKNPYAKLMTDDIFHGGLPEDAFNMIDFLRSRGLSGIAIGRKGDLDGYCGRAEAVYVKNDSEAYTEIVKRLNKFDFISVQFSDFDELYEEYKLAPPEEVLKKLITRTSTWIKLFHDQVKPKTIFCIVGNHGKKELKIEFKGVAAKWKKANAPIAIFMKK